jgi:hypothetical protein
LTTTPVDILEILAQYAPRSYKTQPNSVKGRYSMACPMPDHTADKEHQDHSGSFSVNAESQLYRCFGCGASGNAYKLKQILSVSAPPKPAPPKPPPTPKAPKKIIDHIDHQGVTIDELAKAKGLDPTKLRQDLHWQDISYRGKPAIKIPYPDEDGGDIQYRFRLSVSGEDKFRWQYQSRIRPLGLPDLPNIRSQGHVIILVEGETDYAALRAEGFPVLGIPGASTFKAEWATYLSDLTQIYAWQEPGKGGETFVQKILDQVSHEHVLIITAPAEFKDPSDMAQQLGPERFRPNMEWLMDTAEPAPEPEADPAPVTGYRARRNAHHRSHSKTTRWAVVG